MPASLSKCVCFISLEVFLCFSLAGMGNGGGSSGCALYGADLASSLNTSSLICIVLVCKEGFDGHSPLPDEDYLL